MTQYAAFYTMLTNFAALFDTELRIGGDHAASVLRDIGGRSHTPLPPSKHPLDDTCLIALDHNPHPLAVIVSQALPLIDWHSSGLDDGHVPTEIARRVATTELVGPDGMIYHKDLRIGLFVQSAHTKYPERQHSAEECFIMLGGAGHWQNHPYSPPTPQGQSGAGDIVFHPPNTAHRSITQDYPMIALWRWTGDISYARYTLAG
ncbi:hypothetical protein GCM10007939_11310 [Amylibacter marinus]|uniref:Dimethlysulfonioproprionate lyase n=1 Tax=Amylibacter marinus TaxID=1475483 RepID=A0ABQ5VUE5_9RHOB|nr:dimethylsulfonioproprionate lyase family protein [Amylibacter marinus]GLQ34848.1 hypothetical protein GCM10007939_11310 [Amylibacter marinus]